jgi:hypothetical protein
MALLPHGLRLQSGPIMSADGLDEPGTADRLVGRFRIPAASKVLLFNKGWRVVGKGFELLSKGRGRWLPAG